jgi:hypothetical protein
MLRHWFRTLALPGEGSGGCMQTWPPPMTVPRPTKNKKSLALWQKRPTNTQKRPTNTQKRPTF